MNANSGAGAITPGASAATDKVRVMLVDDAVVVRGLVSRILQAESDIEVVASVSNGQVAVDRMRKGGIDVIVLDIEMPVMDGLTALPLLLECDPDIQF